MVVLTRLFISVAIHSHGMHASGDHIWPVCSYESHLPQLQCIVLSKPCIPHCKKAFIILTITFVTRIARIVPCGSQLWQYNTHGVQEQLKLLQGLGSLLRHQISAIHNKRALFPCLSCELQYSYLSVTCFNHNEWLVTRHELIILFSTLLFYPLIPTKLPYYSPSYIWLFSLYSLGRDWLWIIHLGPLSFSLSFRW